MMNEKQPTTLKRSQVIPLHQPADIYAVLSRLKIGEQIPPQVLIADYQDGSIPPWTVREIEHHNELLVLTVCDETTQSQETLFEQAHCVGRDVFTLPTKTLAGPFYGYHPGCEHARNMLADIRQHARQIVDQCRKAEKRGAA